MRTKAIALTAALLSAVGIQSARADNQNACGAVLCLGGMTLGASGGDGCASYLAAYFSIVSFKHGSFDPWGTLSERGDFINQCSSSDQQTRNLVNGTYGRQEYEP
jgi:hypothetical protein